MNSDDQSAIRRDSLEVLAAVIAELRDLSDSERARVVSTVCAYFRLRAIHLNMGQ